MPSWNDGETSSDSCLGDYHEVGYAPDSVHDPAFSGIDADAPVRCRIHNAVPEKRVAFEGLDTGRRFYGCSVHNEAFNCGFVAWVDPEWPKQLRNSLCKLWDMYHEIKMQGCAEKKMKEKYTTLVSDVNKGMEVSDRVKENEKLKVELFQLKEAQRVDSEHMKLKQQEWDDKMEELKKEKKKAEYNLFDLLQASQLNKDKLKRIKSICEESN